MHRQFWSLVAILTLDSLFFGLTNPQKVVSWLLIIGFGLLFVTLYTFVRSLLLIMGQYGLSVSRQHRRRARTMAALAALLVALQSIGQLGARDVLVIIPLALILYMYTSYGKPAVQASSNISDER